MLLSDGTTGAPLAIRSRPEGSIDAYAAAADIPRARRARWDYEVESPLRDARGFDLSRSAGPPPVVDADERLVGVISQTDLLYLAIPTVRALIRHRGDGIRVGEVMSTPPVTIDGSALLSDAARMMHRDHLHRLVVVDATAADAAAPA